MLVLRKVLGYCTLSFFLVACIIGCISKFTVNLADLFKSLTNVENILNFAASWVFELVFFIIIAIMAIVALATFHKLDDAKQEGQLQKLTLLFAICELAAGFLMLMAYAVSPGGIKNATPVFWLKVILPIVVIIATIVRKAAFVGKNPMWSRIMGAFTMLVMLVFGFLAIQSGFGELHGVVQTFFIITFSLGTIFNIVSIFKK